jgi:hypothetical protein
LYKRITAPSLLDGEGNESETAGWGRIGASGYRDIGASGIAKIAMIAKNAKIEDQCLEVVFTALI